MEKKKRNRWRPKKKPTENYRRSTWVKQRPRQAPKRFGYSPLDPEKKVQSKVVVVDVPSDNHRHKRKHNKDYSRCKNRKLVKEDEISPPREFSSESSIMNSIGSVYHESRNSWTTDKESSFSVIKGSNLVTDRFQNRDLTSTGSFTMEQPSKWVTGIAIASEVTRFLSVMPPLCF